MQRWIIAGLVFLVLLMGGAAFGYRTYQQNRNTRIWLPLPVPEATVEQRREMAADLRAKLGDPVLMGAVCKDSGYAGPMGLAADEATKALLGRLFVEVGTADTPTGRIPSVNVGFNCKVKNFDKMKKPTNRLRDEIMKILGVSGSNEPPF